MHTLRKLSDTQWEVGYYRPPVQGDPHNVWELLVVVSDARHAAAIVSALNGGGSTEAFTEGAWDELRRSLALVPAAKPAQ